MENFGKQNKKKGLVRKNFVVASSLLVLGSCHIRLSLDGSPRVTIFVGG